MKDNSSSSNQGDLSSAAAAPVAIVAGGHGKLLKRSEAARRLGMSVSTLRRREGDLLKPILGPGGVRLFEESQILSVETRRRVGVAPSAPNGDIAADVFELLDLEVHPVDIVKRLRLPPEVVTSLHDQWARMRGGFVVHEDDAELLSAYARGRKAVSASDLVAKVRARTEELQRRLELAAPGSPACRYCGEKPTCVCEPCLLKRRGPIVASRVRLERRTENGFEEARVVAEAMWDDEPFEAGVSACLRMYSDWRKADRFDISTFAEAIENASPY